LVSTASPSLPTTATINNVIFAVTAGSGGISVDSSSAGAARVYYTTLGSGRTIVKATQALLQRKGLASERGVALAA
jgi:hypothetical protein